MPPPTSATVTPRPATTPRPTGTREALTHGAGPAGVGSSPPGAEDREDAAQDRASAVDDRGRASRDRKNAHWDRERAARDRASASEGLGNLRGLLDRAEENPDDMLLIGQAQARLMDERGMVAADAILELLTQAGREKVELRVVAERVVTAIGTG